VGEGGYERLLNAMKYVDETVARRLRCNWFASVQEISDLSLQRRTWLDPKNLNPHWSYVEFVCSYPDDSQLGGAHSEGWLTKSEFDILIELRRMLGAHSAPGGDDYDHAAILNDPAWRQVVEAAEQARQQLLSAITNHDERQMLLGRS
jgi:hypothetical protein